MNRFCLIGELIYYKDEKNSKEAVDDQGWVHTGDVAEIDSHGRIKIIDRVKVVLFLIPPLGTH